MREITKLMVKEYGIMEKGYDFMGYRVNKEDSLSFHHLIVPHRECKKEMIANDGYVRWNGAILRQDSSHNYLHLIERIDPRKFYYITSEMIDENVKGRIEEENLKRIDEILQEFEYENRDREDRNGKGLIKAQYINRIMKREP